MVNNFIKEYSSGLSSYFKTVITEPEDPNMPLENYVVLDNYYNTKVIELENNKRLNPIKELKLVLDTVHELNKEIVRFFIALQEMKPKESNILELIAIHKLNIDDLFKELSDLELIIRNYILSGDYKRAAVIQQFTILNVKALKSFLYKSVFLNLEITPFQYDFEELINNLTSTIENPTYIKQQLQQNATKEPKKLSDKWYALHYVIELKAKGIRRPLTTEGELKKDEIVAIGKEKSGRSGQSFYKCVKKIISDDFKHTKQTFGDHWKQTIIKLSQNDQVIIDYLALNFP